MTRSMFLKLFFLLALLSGVGNIRGQNESHFQDLTVEEFFRKVNIKDTCVLVYFYADWCVPCVKLKPIMAELEKEYYGKIKFLQLDVDKNPKVSLSFEINTLPLFTIYKNSKQVWTNNTFMVKEKLSAKLSQYQ